MGAASGLYSERTDVRELVKEAARNIPADKLKDSRYEFAKSFYLSEEGQKEFIQDAARVLKKHKPGHTDLTEEEFKDVYRKPLQKFYRDLQQIVPDDPGTPVPDGLFINIDPTPVGDLVASLADSTQTDTQKLDAAIKNLDDHAGGKQDAESIGRAAAHAQAIEAVKLAAKNFLDEVAGETPNGLEGKRNSINLGAVAALFKLFRPNHTLAQVAEKILAQMDISRQTGAGRFVMSVASSPIVGALSLPYYGLTNLVQRLGHMGSFLHGLLIGLGDILQEESA